jgi:hypothetical protein
MVSTFVDILDLISSSVPIRNNYQKYFQAKKKKEKSYSWYFYLNSWFIYVETEKKAKIEENK